MTRFLSCPECTTRVAEKQDECEECGFVFRTHDGLRRWDIEHRSKRSFLGIPLVHVAFGMDRATGAKKVAIGWVAIGDVAIGPVAVGFLAIGGLAFGLAAVGVVVGGVWAWGVGEATGWWWR